MADPIKAELAARVKHGLKCAMPIVMGVDGKAAVSITDISELQTQIRVRTENQGVRYFVVKISEQY